MKLLNIDTKRFWTGTEQGKKGIWVVTNAVSGKRRMSSAQTWRMRRGI